VYYQIICFIKKKPIEVCHTITSSYVKYTVQVGVHEVHSQRKVANLKVTLSEILKHMTYVCISKMIYCVEILPLQRLIKTTRVGVNTDIILP